MRTERRFTTLAALAAASLLALAGCAGQGVGAETSPTSATTIEVEDNHGTQTVTVPPRSVVATDNRTFETLDSWGVELSAGAVALMPSTVSYTTDADIVDLGNHREPNLEAVVAVEPDLVINGQRFAQYRDEFASLAPQAAVIDLDPREGEPLDAELKRQVTVLGEIFGKQAQAQQLSADLDAAIAEAKGAYDPAQTVMAVNVSGGEIGYIAPGVGRTLGPVFDILELTPALQVEQASDNHEGDDISVEAIAAANPDWILVLDRDAAVGTGDVPPASAILEDSAALANVTAVQQGNIVYLPADTYINEGIQTYTEFFGTFADALTGQN